MLPLSLFVSLLAGSLTVQAEVFTQNAYSPEALTDQVTSLPGALSPLMSHQFSGYLDITDTKALHYMYFESERDPETDSVIFWTNGGPGKTS